jgi:LCP family protein required for cell wall assembly
VFSNPWVRSALVALAGIAAIGLGFVAFRVPIGRQIAATSAQRAFGHDKINLLILGYQDDEATTDTVIFAHLDVDRRTATLVSIPRDTWVPIPGQGSAKINAAYAFGGAKTSAKVVSRLMGGAPVDATIALQPEGAAQLVEALGGLDVRVDEGMDYDDDAGNLHIHLVAGEHHLTGSQVLGYVRFRHDAASDFGRVRRQQQVLKLLMAQLSQPQNWAKLPRLLTLARKNIATTLTDQQLIALLEIYRNVPDDDIRTFTLPSKPGWVGDASVVFADPRWAKLIGRVLFAKTDPPQDDVVVANATGQADFDKTIVATLRGGGWSVPTFVDQRARTTSVIIGVSPAALQLSKTFAAARLSGPKTTLVIGSDLAPETE